MTPRSIFANLVRSENGAFSTVYGPFLLKSALQPIFRSNNGIGLEIESFEGLVRVFRDGEPIAPGDFFPLVAREDISDIDSILRTIHILNTGRLARTHARIFVKFHPGLFRTPNEMRQEVERIKLAGHEGGLKPERIVCEISEKSGAADDIVVAFTEHMRAIGFRIAIDDYGAGDSDIARMKRIAPDYVKFDASFIRDFLDNSAGHALLRVLVRQLMEDGIEPIFEGLEEVWQLDLCEEIGVPLMQGYVLARPELAPTMFDSAFPESYERLYGGRHMDGLSAPDIGRPATYPAMTRSHHARPARTFGKRQS